MSRETYTKPSSHTQKSGQKAVETIEAICAVAHITKEQWIELLFETGCAYAENTAMSHEISFKWLTDPAFNFWSWWICDYIKDDEELLKIKDGIMSEGEYQQLKENFI